MQLNKEDKLKVEDALIEMLVCAIKSPIHVRAALTEMTIGLADLLTEEEIKRCKEYASYRIKGESK